MANTTTEVPPPVTAQPAALPADALSADPAPGPSRRRPAALAVGLWVLGIGAATVALLGPLAGSVIRYHVSGDAINQITGGDVAALVLVAPVSIIAGTLVWRSHPAGPVLALGPAIYAVYTYTQLVLGGDVARYPGNSERFFLLYLGLFVLGGFIAIRAWPLIDSAALPVLPRWLQRTLGIFFLVMAAFLVLGLHLPGLVDAWKTEPVLPEYLADPAPFWVVKLMDLGIIVPALVVGGIGILRRSAWAHKVAYAAVGWTALLGASVAGMAIVMQANDDPAASATNTLVFAVAAVITVGMAVVAYLPLFRRHPARSPSGFTAERDDSPAEAAAEAAPPRR